MFPISDISDSYKFSSISWPRPELVALVHRREHAIAAYQRRHAVGDRKRGQGRRAVRLAVGEDEAAERFGQRAEAGVIAVRAAAAVAADVQQNQARVFGGKPGIVQAPGLHFSGPVVFDHDVGVAREARQNPRTLGLGQIDRHQLLVARDHLPPQGDAVFDRAEAAHIVAARRLDLDHLGAEVAQMRADHRPGENGPQVEDAQIGERTGA